MRKLVVPLLALLLSCGVAAQLTSPPPRNPNRPPASSPAAQPGPAPNASGSFDQLNQVIENARVDLARLRVDKWKTDANSKRQAEANAESVQRNLTAALPTIVQQVRANPGSVGATFKLYRNLNALYDVMASLTELAGAFGSKDEYQALATDTANLDNLRRALADQVEQMATSRDVEIAQLQARARQGAAAASAPAPKKIVVDDNEPVKKPAKKSTAKKKTTASEQQTPPK